MEVICRGPWTPQSQLFCFSRRPPGYIFRSVQVTDNMSNTVMRHSLTRTLMWRPVDSAGLCDIVIKSGSECIQATSHPHQKHAVWSYKTNWQQFRQAKFRVLKQAQSNSSNTQIWTFKMVLGVFITATAIAALYQNKARKKIFNLVHDLLL